MMRRRPPNSSLIHPATACNKTAYLCWLAGGGGGSTRMSAACFSALIKMVAFHHHVQVFIKFDSKGS